MRNGKNKRHIWNESRNRRLKRYGEALSIAKKALDETCYVEEDRVI